MSQQRRPGLPCNALHRRRQRDAGAQLHDLAFKGQAPHVEADAHGLTRSDKVDPARRHEQQVAWGGDTGGGSHRPAAERDTQEQKMARNSNALGEAWLRPRARLSAAAALLSAAATAPARPQHTGLQVDAVAADVTAKRRVR